LTSSSERLCHRDTRNTVPEEQHPCSGPRAPWVHVIPHLLLYLWYLPQRRKRRKRRRKKRRRRCSGGVELEENEESKKEKRRRKKRIKKKEEEGGRLGSRGVE